MNDDRIITRNGRVPYGSPPPPPASQAAPPPPPPSPTTGARNIEQVIRQQALGHATRVLAGFGHPIPTRDGLARSADDIGAITLTLAARFERWIVEGHDLDGLRQQ